MLGLPFSVRFQERGGSNHAPGRGFDISCNGRWRQRSNVILSHANWRVSSRSHRLLKRAYGNERPAPRHAGLQFQTKINLPRIVLAKRGLALASFFLSPPNSPSDVPILPQTTSFARSQIVPPRSPRGNSLSWPISEPRPLSVKRIHTSRQSTRANEPVWAAAAAGQLQGAEL